MYRYYRITDKQITCSSCTGTIDNAITGKVIAANFKSNAEDKALRIRVLANEAEAIKEEIKNLTQQVGYFNNENWQEISRAEFESNEFEVNKETQEQFKNAKATAIKKHLQQGIPALLLGIFWISLSFPPLNAIVWLTSATLYLSIISTIVIIYSGWDIFTNAFQALKNRNLNMDSQFTFATLLIVVMSWLSFVTAGLSLLFDAGLLILGFRHFGLLIEARTKNKIATGDSILDSLPKTVQISSIETVESKGEIAIEQLKAGDIIQIKQGQKIPTDGVCLSESVNVIPTDISGGSDIIVVKKAGELKQGYQVVDAAVEVQVKKPLLESTLTVLEKQVEVAAKKNMDSTKKLSYISANFVKIVFLIALLTFAFVALYSYFILGTSWLLALTAGLTTAGGECVSACPCVLGSVIPTFGWTAVAKSYEHGVTVLDANILELTSKSKHIIFDLHGTLTTGEKRVKRIQFLELEQKQAEKILSYIKFMEKDSKHLTGEAIKKAFLEKYSHIPLPEEDVKQEDIDTSLGNGLSMLVKGEAGGELLVGNEDFLKKKGLSCELKGVAPIEALHQRNYIAYAGKVVGFIDLYEPIRPEANAVLDYFRGQGFSVKLCTGADKKTADNYAKLLGFDPEKDVKAECSFAGDVHPKETYLNKIQNDPEDQKKKHPAIFVGDAINDSKPISAASVGVVVDSPTMSGASKTGAAAYIGQRSLWPLVKMHAIAKQTTFNIKLSLGFSLLYNLTSFVMMGGFSLFFLGFTINPGLGAAIMVGQALIILLFAAVFQKWPLPTQPALAPATATTSSVTVSQLDASDLVPIASPSKDNAVTNTNHTRPVINNTCCSAMAL